MRIERTYQALTLAIVCIIGAGSSAVGQESAPTPATDELLNDRADPLGSATPQVLQGQPAPASQRTAPAPQRWKMLFFENDFAGRDSPDVLGDELKELPCELLGEPFEFSFGGQLRHRYADERNRLRPPGPGQTTYNLWRWRNYLDARGEFVRVYVESIDADIFGEDLPPTPIDRNRWDLLNAFFDLNVYDAEAGTGVFRYGRQELLYGAQRLVSPLDWSNTRRNFEGVKFFHEGQDWRIDLFSVHPVNAAAEARRFQQFDVRADRADRSIRFSGAYASYSGAPGAVVEPYYFYLDDDITDGLARGARHTLGLRIADTVLAAAPGLGRGNWDYDLEGAWQFGSDAGRRVSAGFLAAEGGRTWNALPWSPRVGGLVYVGSGDHDPFDGETNTFHILFPLGHAYWGIIDNLSGQNLIDGMLRLGLKPTPKFQLTADLHFFAKTSADDFVYTLARTPVGVRGGSREIGQEFDLVGTYTFNPNLSVQLGYAKFWYGDAITRTAPRGDAELFYAMTTLNY